MASAPVRVLAFGLVLPLGVACGPGAPSDGSATAATSGASTAISGRLGSWEVSDPADPPRLIGTLSTSDPDAAVQLNGAFDAVFCDTFVLNVGD